ncbi:MAG: MutS-related protein [[Ruminococcus] torques]
MRQAALIVLDGTAGILCAGVFRLILDLSDRIFTSVGASDDLASGQSTFMVEMNGSGKYSAEMRTSQEPV